MKKLLLFLCMAVTASTAATAQDLTSAGNYDSCGSQHIMYYNHVLPGALTQYRIEHAPGDGTKDTVQVFSPQSTYVYHAYASPGVYTAKAVLLQNNTRVDSITQSVMHGTCTVFYGSIYNDANSNCTYNSGTDPLVYAPFQIRVDSANIPVDTVYAFVGWQYMRWSVNSTPATYKFTILNPSPLYTSSCQTGNSLTVNYPSGSTSNLNFGYTCNSTGFDLSGIFSAFLRTSTAGSSWIMGYYNNAGCMPQSGTVTFQVSPKYSINSANVSPTPASIAGNLITWNFSGLAVGSTNYVYIPVTPTTVYQSGDTACNTMTINPIAGDANPANNVISRCDSLRTAFDPNDKSSAPSGNITAGTTLTYHINFENLGNDTAFNIHILDTLSNTLDAASFQLLSASHAMRSSLLEMAGGMKAMKFEFPNIRLADKTKPARNKGYVRFTMKTKTGLANGTNIPNRAGIYFDYNPVVMTNTAMNRIGVPQSVSVLEAASANSIHPNPATDRLTISNADGKLTSAVLMNTTGQVVRQWNIGVGENSVSLEGLSAGFYFVQLHGSAGVQVEKLEKR